MTVCWNMGSERSEIATRKNEVTFAPFVSCDALKAGTSAAHTTKIVVTNM